MANWTKLLIGTTIFIISYITAAPLTEAINKADIQSLKEMLKELGPVSQMLNIPTEHNRKDTIHPAKKIDQQRLRLNG